MRVDITQLAPHTSLAADHVDSFLSCAEFVDIAPGYVGAVGDAVSVAETDVEVGQVVVREDYLVGSAHQSAEVGGQSPPLHHVVLGQGQVDGFVGPVYAFLGGRYIPPHSFLPLPVIRRQRQVIFDIIFLHPFFDARL